MPFSTDRDLLAVEPNAFTEATFASLKRLEVGDGVVSGTTLTSATANFEAAQVGAGDVVIIAGTACEVIARVNATTLTVSRLRDRLDDAAIAPAAGSSLAVVVRTLEPTAQLVHDFLLARLGIDVDDDNAAVTEDHIVSLSLLSKLEVLGTLAQVYTAAVTLGMDDPAFRQKAADYERRYIAACRLSLIQLDLDGDGVADAVRDLGTILLRRV